MTRARVATLFLTAAALLLLGAPAAALAAPAAVATADLAFVRVGSDGDPDIWTTQPVARQLSTTPQAMDPAYRADGARIAFSDGRDLFTMAADGTGTVRLTDDAAVDRRPSYLRNGRGLLFDRSEPGGGSNIYYLALSRTGTPTGSPVRVTRSTTGQHNENADVSPDGTAFLFQSDRTGTTDVYRLDLARESAGNPADRICSDCRDPDWSPDGQNLLYVRFELWTAQIDGTGNRIVTNGGTQVSEPAYSADGSRIAFSRAEPATGSAGVFVIRTGEENRRNPAVDVAPSPADESAPAWRPAT